MQSGVIEVYHRPYDPRRPVVCIDEQPIQWIGETRTPIPAKPGPPLRHDDEYKRNGTANRFLAFAPRVGWRHGSVTGRRTAKDFGTFLRYVVGEVYAEAEKVVLVADNRNVHGVGNWYEALDPATARRIAEQVEWYDTPKHGSWRNVAEWALGVSCSRPAFRRVGASRAS